jgi:hypothetical protein
MSCRVLARRVEHAILNELLLCAHAQGVRRLIGLHQRTARNGLVESHYEKLGFTRHDTRADGTAVWYLDIDEAAPFDVPMRIRRTGYDAIESLSAGWPHLEEAQSCTSQ